MKNIEDVSDNLYNMSKKHSDFFRTKKWIVGISTKLINNYDFQEFIFLQLSRFPQRYCMDLFICLDRYWLNLTEDNFDSILKKIEHPKIGLAFVEFIYKFLQIDSLKLIMNAPISRNDKLIYFDYYKDFPYKLISNSNKELIESDLDVNINELYIIGKTMRETNVKFCDSILEIEGLTKHIKWRYFKLRLKNIFPSSR